MGGPGCGEGIAQPGCGLARLPRRVAVLTFRAMPPSTAPRSTPDAEREAQEASDAARGGAAKQAYVQRIFSEIAPRYDLINHVLSLNVDRAWRRRALRALGWEREPQGTFLDLCAGTLDVGALLARQAGFRGYVVGADFAEPMLRAG